MPVDDDKDMTQRYLMRQRGRALYRAVHRGTREMDFLLGKFATARIGEMDHEDLALFEELLALPDPVLAGALIDGTGDFPEPLQQLLETVRRFHRGDEQG